MRNLLAALFLLAPVSASAALNWTIVRDSGSAVMAEPSTVMFRVSNAATSTTRITDLTLTVPTGYTIESGIAPSGWTVSSIEVYEFGSGYHRVNFSATGSCPDKGLAAGSSALFGVRAVSPATSADTSDELFLSIDLIFFEIDMTFAEGNCADPAVSAQPLANASWPRVGLSAQLNIEPRTLAADEELTVTMTVTNKSTARARNIAPTSPVSAPAPAQFTQSSGPSPATLTLSSGASGSFTWILRAVSDGAFTVSASASNGTVSSPVAVSPQGSVGLVTAQTSIHPSKVVSGQTVEVSLTVSNNGQEPIQSVVPEPLTVLGTASAVIESGPTPTAVGVLPPGSTTSFSWTYRISGSPGDTYSFSGAALIVTDGNSQLLESAAASGSVVVHTLTIAPSSILDGATKTVIYRVANGGGTAIKEFSLSAPNSTYFAPADSPFANVPSGWTAQKSTFPTLYRWTASSAAAYIQPGSSMDFGFTYNKVGTGSMSSSMTFTHSATLVLDDGFSAGVQAAITVLVAKTAADVGSPVVISGPGTNTLIWNNPSDHAGVLVLRATGAAVAATPESGRQYQAGETLGSAVVAYSNSGFANSFVDQLLTNGTRYYYKVFNHDSYFNYGTGSAPSSQGLFSEPTAGAAGTPLWCYSTGLPMLVQPTRDSTGAVMAASQTGALTSNLSDGGERMRPVQLSGVVQSRFPIIGSLQGRSGRWAIVGTQSKTTGQTARGHLVNSATGAIAWTAPGLASDEHLQAPPSIQLNGSNATFSAKYPGKDLVFFATRNSALPSRTASNNRVFAVSSVDGSQVWSYQPANLDIVSGYMALLSGTNRLFVASYSNGNTQPSLRVLDTVNGGAPLASFKLGDLATGVSLDWVGQQYTQALVANTAGMAYGIDLASLSQTPAWSVNLGGAPTSFLFPVGSGFLALLDSGIKRYVTTATSATLAWSAAVPGASGMAIDTARDTVLVGSSDGTLYEFADGATGGATVTPLRRISVSPGKRLSGPTLDVTRGRLYVGTEDGRLCAFSYP